MVTALVSTRMARSLRTTGRISELNQRLTRLVERHAPQLIVPVSIGPDSAVTLLITMGDNPERLNTEASGHVPVPQRPRRIHTGAALPGRCT